MELSLRLLLFFAICLIIILIFPPSSNAQFNVYGLNLEMIKMRLNNPQPPLYLQQFQLQVDYTHNNKVIDYGIVTVNTVQDRADYIFLESINRNPFNLPRVESTGDLCFRLFVQNGQILFDDCLQIRDLANNAYYSSKYVTKPKNDGTGNGGGMLMYKVIQFMVENRDQTRAMLEQSFINAQVNGLLAKCPCTAPVIIASFEAALILIILISFFYWKFKQSKSKNGAKINKNANFDKTARLNNIIYSENSTTGASSIGWSIKESTTSPYYSDVVDHQQKNRPTKNDLFIIGRDGESQSPQQTIATAINTKPSMMPTFSKSILEQILKNPKSTKAKKQPPKPPPPDYKNEAFDDTSELSSFNEERVYDCLEKPKSQN